MRITWPCVGDKFTTKSGDEYVVIEVNGCNNILIRFNNGFEKVVSKGSIISGSIRFPKIRVGQTYKDKLGDEVELIKLEKNGKSTFRWKDGYERTCSSSAIYLNTIMREEDSRMLNPKVKVGLKGIINGGYNYEVISVKNSNEVTIKLFEPVEHTTVVKSCNLLKGTVTNKYAPSVAGVGVLGDCVFDTSSKGYKTWSGLLKRVYTPYSENERINYGTTCTVASEWHYLSNFLNWFNTQKLEDNWHIDKDIIKKGNREYGPDFCVFVPPEVNWFFTNRRNYRGEWPIGVTYHERINKWQATCSTNGKGNGYIGVYSSPEEAFYAYKLVKEQFAKDLAKKWKDVVDDRVIHALMNFTVSIDD